jgi:phosphoribosylformylglycinamidine (FGAM) synthase-like enzyme
VGNRARVAGAAGQRLPDHARRSDRAARFNNEFGRPALLGYFRSFSVSVDGRLWGYHKPIMIAGGSGMIADGQTHKLPLAAGDRVIVLGGPAMLIGLAAARLPR